MIQKYPVGLQDFGEIRNGGYLYVDKTPYAYKLATQSKYYFLSRPRRFGKSLMISTLECLFQGKKELFKHLFIEDKWDWDKTNPVIRISFSNIGHKELGLSNAIDNRLNQIAAENNFHLKSTSISQKFKELIEALSATIGKVVVLIDEYDKPIIDYLGDQTQKALENREILKSFYSILKDADPHLKLVFITGVSKFTRVSIFSDLNNLLDLTSNQFFSAICGITQDELESNFSEELKYADKEQIKEWYNGYTWDTKTYVYNPFSLLSFFIEGFVFKNYWFETGTPTFLIRLVKNAKLYDFDGKETTISHLSSYDIERLQPLPLLFQTGYLTIESYDEESGIYTLKYPNKEVKKAYLDVLLEEYLHFPQEHGIILVYEIKKALEKGDLAHVEQMLNSLFKSLPYELWQKENEHFYHATIHISFSLLGVFIQSQIQTSDGRMDALVQTKDYVYCFEFKLDESAEVALQQIADKGYLVPFSHDPRKKISVGINFSKELKKVGEMKWEEVQ